MSMIMMIESVSAVAPADAPAERSEATIPFPGANDWGSGMLFGARDDNENSISLEKAWHGLHFLLTGDPWSGAGHRAFLLCGGVEQGEDMGYGPARFFEPEEVRGIHETLQPISSDDLWSAFNAEQMAAEEIYGAGWDDEEESDLREEYLSYYEQLKEFVARTAQEGNSLRIAMT